MNCCENCFCDEYIIKYIKDNGEIGDCDYCDEGDTLVIDSYSLAHFFDIFFSYYQKTEHGEHYIHYVHSDPSEFGDSLFYLIQEDWEIFSESTNESLLYDIVNWNRDETENYIDDSILFSKATDAFSYLDASFMWSQLSNRLINENRFFPKKDLDLYYSSDDLLKEVEGVLKELEVIITPEKQFYRSRIGKYSIKKELEAPPRDKVIKGGRANPPGISVLYCAYSLETAIAEVRPWNSAEITVATLCTKENLRLIDLSKVEPIKSPFQVKTNVLHEIRNRGLLLNLQEMLSRPIEPYKSEIDYVPSQFLTEFIKHLGYDGLIFKSSLGKDKNVVIYAPNKTEIKELSYIEVKKIEYDFKPITF